MEISYRDGQLRLICLSGRDAQKALGNQTAKKLQRRLADLDAAGNVRELVAGKPHPLAGDRQGQFAMDVGSGMRLVFEADPPIPQLKAGGINWGEVSNITIVFIGDYHD